MKIVSLIIIIILASCRVVSSQISAIYTLDKFDNQHECNIYLFKNGNYYIELPESKSPDIMESLVVSYGKYSLKNKQLTLQDLVQNYKMKFIFENNKLKAVVSFKWLQNQNFTFYSKNEEIEPLFSSIKLNPSSLLSERLKYKHINSNPFPLEYGEYINENGYMLNIDSHNKYKFEFNKIIISSGEWSRDGNELRLYDVTLKYSFYVLIGKGILKSKLLPSDYIGYSLYRK